MMLREHLRAIAEREPAPVLSAGFFARARRRARRRQMVVAAVLTVAGAGLVGFPTGGSTDVASSGFSRLTVLASTPLGGWTGWVLLMALLVVLAVLWRDLPRVSVIRRLLAVAVVGAVLVLAAPPGTALWGEPRGRLGLPDRLATPGSWALAAEFRQSPPGLVAMVYSGPATYGDLEEGRAVLLAADGDRYRVLDKFTDPLDQMYTEAPAGGQTWPLVSPDGRRLFDGDSRIYDLVTGDLVDGPRSGSIPAGWSADGRRLVRSLKGGNGEPVAWEVWDLPSQRILQTIAQEGVGEALAHGAALSPDGTRVAVEQGDNIAVYPVAGGDPITWPRDGWRLGDSTAWSPNGRLAMVRRTGCIGCFGTPQSGELRVVDVETGATVEGGAFPRLPADVVVRVQGWRSPSQLVVQVGQGVEIFTLGEATPERMLTLPEGVETVEIAASRLADPQRPAETPTYGPPNVLLWLVLGACGAPMLLAAGFVGLYRKVRTTKRL
ncbi:hypothetical protein [Asanoa siamensis]|uniref:WD40 repeat protein n=1 Tax=Asanoa siamensis TaxID=926357 RepID=A0ABQ4D4P7_9ACTN|nr:hypothetical protein [Asanoa siamensis]GIF78509.1 hypothetical protein Asi02nite_80270 [Asanoa siamensis]